MSRVPRDRPNEGIVTDVPTMPAQPTDSSIQVFFGQGRRHQVALLQLLATADARTMERTHKMVMADRLPRWLGMAPVNSFQETSLRANDAGWSEVATTARGRRPCTKTEKENVMENKRESEQGTNETSSQFLQPREQPKRRGNLRSQLIPRHVAVVTTHTTTGQSK